MSLRLRALLGLALAAGALAALPASALAAGETINVAPSNLQAGGSPTITTTVGFASGDAPQTVVTNLAPGLLFNLNANPSCRVTQQLTTACQIGTATINAVITGTTIPVPSTANLYLVPPATGTSDVAGIDVHIMSPSALDQYTGVSFNPSSPGGLTLTSANLPNSVILSGITIPIQITSIRTVFNPTLNGQPFNRLPTSCGAATSTMSVTYYGGANGLASGSFTPTGCPMASGSTAGLATGHPRLMFNVEDTGGVMIASVALGLPGGLKFFRSAIVSHRTCTKKHRKKKCTTTTLIKGLGISGASASTVSLKAGKLVITLKKPSASWSIQVAGPLLSEAKSVRTKVKRHKAGTLSFTLKTTDTNHTSTSLTLKLKAH